MRKGGQWSMVVVERATVHGQQVVAQLQGCVDRDQAFAWRGAEVALERQWLPPLAEGSFYWADLVGLAVRNEQGDDLGTVAEVFSNGAHEVLRVVEPAAAGPVERLVPFVEAVVVEVSLSDRVVKVRWERDW
jgi:16S rRNA processing protein RimM